MAQYHIRGVDLEIPDALVTDALARSFESGKYEHSEAEALLRHLRPRDRFLDLGAGAGFLSALALSRLRPRHITGVEAGSVMAGVAAANLDRNGGIGRRILWGAVVPDACTAQTVPFTVRRAFWASGIAAPERAKGVKIENVPALRFGALLQRFDPTVVCLDIEGGERDLFHALPIPDRRLPPNLRLIVMELHGGAYGTAGIKRLFDDLSALGFCYCPSGSSGGTVVFERLKTEHDLRPE